MTSILLVEDHQIMARAITRLLQDKGRLDVIVVADSAEAAQAKLPDLKVDLVLIDVSLPKMSGIDLAEKIHADYPALPCLMLSGHRGSQYVNRAMEVGARGYILKEDVEGIVEGVRQVLDGKLFISEEIREAWLSRGQP